MKLYIWAQSGPGSDLVTRCMYISNSFGHLVDGVINLSILKSICFYILRRGNFKADNFARNLVHRLAHNYQTAENFLHFVKL